MSLDTKIIIANVVGSIAFLGGMALLLFTPLSSAFMLAGICCLYLTGRWRKQKKLEMTKQGIPVPVPSAKAINRNLLLVIISIGVLLAITTPLFLYLSPGLQEEAPTFICATVAGYALIAFILWRKRVPSSP